MTTGIILPVLAIVMMLILATRHFQRGSVSTSLTWQLALLWMMIIATLWAAVTLTTHLT